MVKQHFDDPVTRHLFVFVGELRRGAKKCGSGGAPWLQRWLHNRTSSLKPQYSKNLDEIYEKVF